MSGEANKFEHWGEAEEVAAAASFIVCMAGGSLVWLMDTTTYASLELQPHAPSASNIGPAEATEQIFGPAFVGAALAALATSRVRHALHTRRQRTVERKKLVAQKAAHEIEMLELWSSLDSSSISRKPL